MTLASLEHYSSYVREVDGECVFVRLSNNYLFSGSKSGEVACWDLSTGREMWRLDFEGPCSDSDSNKELFFFTESDNIHAIRIDSGELIWTAKLEGSSDFVQVSNGFVWVTSSVYNFEIQDYSEGSVWQIDFEGRIRNRWQTEGRAWSFSIQENLLVMGLSRPKSGYAIVSENGINYPELEERHPVTIGNGGSGVPVVLGHSNGMVTEVVEQEVKSVSEVESSVRAIDYCGGWVVGLDSGYVTSSKHLGSWSINLSGVIDVLCFGPSLDNNEWVWVPSWSDDSSVVSLLNPKKGSIELEIRHHSRIGCVFSDESVICLGDYSGCITVIEKDVLRRRFTSPMEEMSEKGRSMELRKKIRGLRRG